MAGAKRVEERRALSFFPSSMISFDARNASYRNEIPCKKKDVEAVYYVLLMTSCIMYNRRVQSLS